MQEDNDIILLQRGEVIITQNQIPHFKEMINNINNVDRPTLPKPPESEVMYENNSIIGLVIGIVVLGIIVVMILSRIL